MCLSPAQDQANGFPFPAGPWRARPGHCSSSTARPHGPLGCRNCWLQLRRQPGHRDGSPTALTLLPRCWLCRSRPSPWAHGAARHQPGAQGGPSASGTALLVPLKATSAGALYDFVLCKACPCSTLLLLLQPTALTAALWPSKADLFFFFPRLPFRIQ